MDIQFKHIPPTDLHNVWDAPVLPGLHEVKARTDAAWKPEDIYTTLRMGTSLLQLVLVDGEYGGFLVMSPSVNAYTGKRTLTVWIAHSLHKRAGEATATMDRLIEESRSLGFTRLLLYSPRVSWARRLRRWGFHVGEVEFVKELA